MDQKLFWVGCMQSQFYADYNEKKIFENSHFFGYFAHSEVLGFFLIFPKLRGRKILKFRFIGQFLTLKNMATKFLLMLLIDKTIKSINS